MVHSRQDGSVDEQVLLAGAGTPQLEMIEVDGQ